MESGWHRKGWLKKMAVGVPLEQDQVLDGSSHPPERCLTFPSGQEGLVRIRGAKAATGLPGSCQELGGELALLLKEVLLQDIRVEQCESKGGVWSQYAALD